MSITTQKNGTLEYLTAEGITVPHCFTTRFGGVSEGQFDSLNIAIKEGEKEEHVEKNLSILASALGFEVKNMVLTRQTHTNWVRVVTKEDHMGPFHRPYPECDALVTNDPGTARMIFTADCTPILFHDPVTGAVGAAHAGWRGTATAIVKNVVEAMVREFGCDPANIHAAIGPNIGFCHFETDANVPDAMVEAFGDEVKEFIQPKGNKYYVNLKEINALILRRAGVRHIEISDACTVCQSHRFWSHRVTGGLRGSQGAIILCKEEQK